MARTGSPATMPPPPKPPPAARCSHGGPRSVAQAPRAAQVRSTKEKIAAVRLMTASRAASQRVVPAWAGLVPAQVARSTPAPRPGGSLPRIARGLARQLRELVERECLAAAARVDARATAQPRD